MGNNAFVSSNKRKIDVRIRGARRKYERGCKLGNKGSDACSVMVMTFFHMHIILLYLWAVSSGIEAKMYNSFCTFIVYV